jgi:uncharacterized repeat protein (TIGR01451 family)
VPTVSKDQIAWNSVAAFAQAVGGAALLPAESPKVGITASDHRFAISKTADHASAGFGDLVNYTVTVTNIGTAGSDQTTASDQLPAGLDFVSADHGGSYDSATRAVTWPVAALARDASTVFQITARIDGEQTRSTVTNRATVLTPRGYSPTIGADPCAGDGAAACADVTVPITSHGLAFTGGTVPIVAAAGALAAILAGLALVIWRRRRARRS